MDGFLSQRTSFPIEILIHDDASTDGTEQILREYAEAHPDLLFPLFEAENQYSRGHSDTMDFYNYRRARGKYIAYCEGDDYWTDQDKLQRQVDFLEKNIEYSVCFHRCKRLDAETGKCSDDYCSSLFAEHPEGVEISLDLFFRRWVTQPLTMVFRRSSFSFGWRLRYKYYRDVHEIYHLLREGKGYLLNFFGGVYVRHLSGVSSKIGKQKQDVLTYEIAKELHDKNPDEPSAKRNYANALRYLIATNSNLAGLSTLSLSLKYLQLSLDFKFVVKQIIKRHIVKHS